MRGVLTGFKGDWKFKVSALHLTRWYNCRPLALVCICLKLPIQVHMPSLPGNTWAALSVQ